MTVREQVAGVPRTNRYNNLDGLRGVASVVVLVSHCLAVIPVFDQGPDGPPYNGPAPWIYYSPLHILWGGHEAVVVFFILSGFVLTVPYFNRRNHWFAYYPSRLIRLYLPVTAALIFAFVVTHLVPRSTGADPSYYMRAHDGPYRLEATLQDGLLLAGTSNLDGPLWSLRWEVLFSLLLPVYFVAARLVRHWKLWTILALATFAGLMTQIEEPAFSWLPIFAVGMIMALHVEPLRNLAVTISTVKYGMLAWRGIAVVSVVLLTADYTLSRWLPQWSGLSLTCTLLGGAGLVFLALNEKVFGRFLSSTAVQFLGTLSFSLYLIHEPVIIATAIVLPLHLRWVTGFIAMPLSITLAWGFYHLVESPSHRLSQRVRRLINQRVDDQAWTLRAPESDVSTD